MNDDKTYPDCEFIHTDSSGWFCCIHDVIMLQKHEPVMCTEARDIIDGSDNRTVPGIGPGTWDNSALARNQENHAIQRQQTPASTLYRLYTEDIGDVAAIVSRYFAGATLYQGVGLWYSTRENSCIIEILGTPNDLQAVVHLAGDIRQLNEQACVIVTWHAINRLDVA